MNDADVVVAVVVMVVVVVVVVAILSGTSLSDFTGPPFTPTSYERFG